MTYIGEISALATALCWAISVVLFRQVGHAFSPIALNLWKGLIAISGLMVVVFFIPSEFPEAGHFFWLLLSGLIGIGIGDTAFFAALNRLGERSTLLVAETMAPILTAMLAIIWISEWLNGYQWAAMLFILLGVDLVLKAGKNDDKSVFSLSGVGFACIAALCQAIGAVIGREVLLNSQVDAVTASLIRLSGGLIFILTALILTRRPYFPAKSVKTKAWGTLVAATFLGTFIAMVLQMYAFAHAEAAVVQSLFASCIIFSLIIARIQGQIVSSKAVIGSLIAIFGVALVFLL